VDVSSYDVSKVDGSVAYVANNQMLLINANGSDRRVLVDGGAVDVNNPYLNNIVNPVFSPNGKTIAYGHKGLSFYALDTDVSNLVLENDFDDLETVCLFRELYWPENIPRWDETAHHAWLLRRRLPRSIIPQATHW
jgi:hypothetical protein